MVGVYEPVINVKELQVQKIWADGAKSTDETAADITLASTATGSTITIGRQSVTGSNQTNVKIVGRTSTTGIFLNPNGTLQLTDSGNPSGNGTGAMLQLDSTTKTLRLNRLTTAQGTTLSGSAVGAGTSSGLIWLNTDTGKIEYMSGSNIYALAGTIR